MHSELRNKLLILAFLAPIFCLGQGTPTYVFGTVTNQIQKEMSFHFLKDYISYEEIQFDIQLNEADRFGIQFELSEALPARLVYKNTEIPLTVMPGDSISITFDALNPAQNINFAGPGAVQNQWFFESALAFREFSEEVLNEEIIKRNPYEFGIYLERVKGQMLRFLDGWLVGKNVSPKVVGFITSDLEYWVADQFLRYPFVKTATSGLSSLIELPDNYFHFVRQLLINDPEMLSSDNYLNFLDRLQQFWAEGASQRHKLENQIREIEILAPRMLLLAQADQPPVLADLKKGDVVLDLAEVSTVRSKVEINGEFVDGFWKKVKTQNGQVGFVHEAGIQGQQPRIGDKIENLFKGKVKAFLLTKGYHWKEDISKNDLIAELDELGGAEEFKSFVLGLDVLSSIESYHLQNPTVLNSEEVNRLYGEEPVVVPPSVVGSLAGYNPRANQPVALPDLGRELQPEPEAQDARITGVISGLGKKEAAISYLLDPVQMKDEKRIIKVDAGGRFNTTVPLTHAQVVNFSVGNQQIKLLFSPGQSTRIQTSASSLKSNSSFSDANSSANKFLLDITKYIDQNESVYNRMIKELDGKGFTQYIDKYRSDWTASLNQLNDLDPTSRNLLQAEVDYWYGNQLMNFPWEQPLRLDRPAPLTMEESFYNFVEELNLSEDDYIWNPTFLNYLDQVLEYIHREQGYDIQTIAKTRLSGKTYWWALGQNLARFIRRGDIASSIDQLSSYFDQCPYPEFSNRLKELYNENRGLGYGDPAPNFSLTDVFGNEVDLEELKGSVVYIDFWATWCTPCLTKMRNSKQWKANFIGKPVKFLYISLDRDAQKWRNYLSNNQIQGTHLHAGNKGVFSSEVARAYGVKKLPAVFIVNKDGTIEYSSPQQGGSVLTSEIIQALL